MTKRCAISLLFVLGLFAQFPAQPQQKPQSQSSSSDARSPQQQTSAQGDDDVVRITTNLVQVDVVVTDDKGRQVTDLHPEDFEVREDGREQKLTNFSYVSVGPTSATLTNAAAVLPSGADRKTVVPPARLRPEQIKRTIALVVDDLGLSAESTNFVRKSLRKFVDEQMQPGDLIAVIRTSAGVGALQQFTSDKRQLYAAIERVVWNPRSRNGLSAFAPLNNGLDQMAAQAQQMVNGSTSELTQDARSTSTNQREDNTSGDDPNRGREELLTVGTLGALNYVVRGMRELPGRKATIIFSDGMRIDSSQTLEAMRTLTERATRASVVFYVLDARGLPTLYFTAADAPGESALGSRPTPAGNAQALSSRSGEYFDTQNGLNYLAQQTGGLFLHDTNDFRGSLKRVIEDQSGYYLLGYRPEESTFDQRTGARRFHQFDVKVKRRGLHVRTRKGFFGVTNEQQQPVLATRSAQLFNAISSPFNASGVSLRLTSLFGNDPQTGSFMLSLLHINVHDLTFTDDVDGWKKAEMDVIALTFNVAGQVVDELNLTQTIRARKTTFESIQQNGMVYALKVPIKKPGAYQLRIAVRDVATARVGSASQYIEVPKLENKHLALSGIALSGVDPAVASTSATGSQTSPTQSALENGSEGLVDPLNAQSSPAVRKFKRGEVLQFGYIIYNAQVVANRTQLQTQVRIFRDGQLVYAGRVTPLQPGNDTGPSRLSAGGGVRLSADMVPGDYYLQVIVTDSLAKSKYKTVTQWADFEVQ
jgi:VWFA-related protein